MEPPSSAHPDQMRRMTQLWMQAQPIVTAYIASVVRDRHHVEDLTQETAAAIASAFERYDADKPFTPWALGVARNKVLMYLRTSKRDKHLFDENQLIDLAQAHQSLADTFIERKQALHQCLKSLPETSRSLLLRRYFENEKVNAIAKSMGRTEGAISTTLYRIRGTLAACIRKRMGGIGANA